MVYAALFFPLASNLWDKIHNRKPGFEANYLHRQKTTNMWSGTCLEELGLALSPSFSFQILSHSKRVKAIFEHGLCTPISQYLHSDEPNICTDVITWKQQMSLHMYKKGPRTMSNATSQVLLAMDVTQLAQECPPVLLVFHSKRKVKRRRGGDHSSQNGSYSQSMFNSQSHSNGCHQKYSS